MSVTDAREVWQRGPVEGVPPLLQPVAHALLQAAEDAARYCEDFPATLLWERPAQLASVGFHLMHLRGVVDRLFTYARGESLSPEQMRQLNAEKEIAPESVRVRDFVEAFSKEVDKAIIQLRQTPESILTEQRTIGRKQIPTTVSGLLFHAAEHCQRHIGQLLVTIRILRERAS